MKTKLLLAIAWCLAGSTLLLGQAPAPAPKETTATEIPGVIAAGSKVQLIWQGFEGADGIVGDAQGNLLFAERTANRVSKIDKNDKTTSLLTDTNEAGALAIDYKGRILDIERKDPQRVRELAPERVVLADHFGDQKFEGMRDLMVDKKGGVYITDGRTSRKGSVVCYIDPSGKISDLLDDVDGANGLVLSPDEKTAYITDTPNEYLLAYDVQPDGRLTNRRNFGHLEGGKRTGGDGVAIDGAGRVYVATPTGIQVFDAKGQNLGTIPTPRPDTSLAFAGPDKKTLYIVGRGADGPGDQGQARSIYKVQMIAQGFKGRAK
jgi:gluconolactonase